METKLEELNLKRAAAKFKNVAATAIEQAGEAVDDASGGNFDAIATRIDKDHAQAAARFERVTGEMQGKGSPASAVTTAKARTFLQDRLGKIASEAKTS